MKPHPAKNKSAAMTLVEVLVVVAVLAVFIAMFLPALTPRKRHSRLNCVNCLKQVGLAYRMWASDNGDKYPFELSVTNGGTKELNFGGNAWLNYLVMSNELSTPRFLVCPADQEHQPPATNFSAQLIGHISYFIGLDATQNDPQTILAGDANLATNGVPVNSGWLEITSNAPMAWTAQRHVNAGNIALGDGSVQSLSNSALTNQLSQTGLANNHFLIP
jgi:prepilin-type processing-associated H-X9-DG protein